MNKNYVWLSWLMGADITTTQIGLKIGALEGNVLWDLDYMLLIKAIALVIAGALMLLLNGKQFVWIQRISLGGMGLVVVNNAFVISQIV